MDDRILGERKVLIAERINRDHGIVGELSRLENRCHSLEYRVAGIGNRGSAELGDHDPVGCAISFERVRLDESRLIGDFTVAYSESTR